MEYLAHLLVLVFIELLIVSQNACSGTISCFVCSSRNSSYSECEDPFNAGYTTYVERCKVPRRGHIGEFPAHFCIKIIGTSYATNEKIVIRRCTEATMDTQCGKFRFGDELLRGCILTCDLDGCNKSTKISTSYTLFLICGVTLLLSSICKSSTSSSDGIISSDLKIPTLSSAKFIVFENEKSIVSTSTPIPAAGRRGILLT